METDKPAFGIGIKVMVLDGKKYNGKLFHKLGTIVDDNYTSRGIKMDDFENEASSKGIYYIDWRKLRLVSFATEDDVHKKLTEAELILRHEMYIEAKERTNKIEPIIAKEANTMKFEKVLNLWNKTKIKQIEDNATAKIEIETEKIKIKDPFFIAATNASMAFINSINESINKMEYSDIEKQRYKNKMCNSFSYCSEVTEKSKKERELIIVEINKESDLAKNKLAKRYEEICANLFACTTYEQERAVMLAYGIINEQGLIDYNTEI